MILNVCVRDNKMVSEQVCKECTYCHCRHTGEPTTRERLDAATYGNRDYWQSEIGDFCDGLRASNAGGQENREIPRPESGRAG